MDASGFLSMFRPEIDGLDFFVVLDVLRSALFEDAGVVHNRHVGGDAQGDVEIVLDDDVADMGRQRVENGDEIASLRGRKSGGRLVEENEPRRAGQSERNFK